MTEVVYLYYRDLQLTERSDEKVALYHRIPAG
jgi:hypothetical protein